MYISHIMYNQNRSVPTLRKQYGVMTVELS
nr:MAG TPA: hypothetical protein [Caudoviricetes sp.]